jgi:uncharacterized protein (DUF1684 family)
MKRTVQVLLAGTFLLAAALLSGSCSHKPHVPPLSPADSARIVQENITHRAEVDQFFTTDPGSPFRRDSTITYHGIRWFPIDPRYHGYSVLHQFAQPETVTVLGTKGEQRRQLRYGYFEFPVPDEDGVPVLLKLNVYKFTPYDGERYFLYRDHLSIWFTDRTTGKETYTVGRYVDVGNEHPDRTHLYTIDLNMAYNPYCAYSPMYSCAMPREEDRLDLALRVGELKYHE